MKKQRRAFFLIEALCAMSGILLATLVVISCRCSVQRLTDTYFYSQNRFDSSQTYTVVPVIKTGVAVPFSSLNMRGVRSHGVTSYEYIT